MYLEHFGLGVNPFGLSPKIDFLYQSGTFEESMAHLIYGLDNHEAIVLITGAIGTGKTMALQSFLTNLGPRFESALITNTRVTAIELLKLILEDLDVSFPMGSDKSDLLILFKEYLLNASREGKIVLLIVDEAQNLAPDVLEEIRLLTNLGQGESQPVQIILVGQPELEATVNRPDLAQIRQRIRVHYNLDPLSRQETEEYIHHRMGVAGCDRKVFTSEAIDTIFQFSRGVPRLINTMAGEALLAAFVAGHEKVQAGDVEGGEEFRFQTGPTPEPVPTPPVAAPEPPPPAPPPVMSPLIEEPVPQHTYATRSRDRSTGGVVRIVRGWAIAVLVVIAVVVLFFTGVFDGVEESINPRPDRGEETVTVAEAVIPDPLELDKPAAIAEETPADPDPVTEEEKPIAEPAVGVEKAVDEPPDRTVEPETEAPPTASPALETEAPPTVSPAPETVPVSNGDIFIHISSFRTPERAESFARRWPSSRVGVISRMERIRGQDWHRIYIGPFPDRNQALMEALRLQESGVIDFYKVTKLALDQGS